MSNAITTAWLIGTYSGAEAKRIKELSELGIGYFIASEYGKGQSYGIEAAFRAAASDDLPDHVRLATDIQVKNLEKQLLRRSGLPERRHTALEAAKLVHQASSLFDTVDSQPKYTQAMRRKQSERPELL